MMELTETEEVGLKIIALIREGQLDMFKCAVCSEQMQKNRDCMGEGENQSPVFYHPDVGEFYSCPIRFIPNSVHTFLDMYDYIEKYPASAPSYEDVNPRFWASVKFYENFKNELEHKKLDKKSDPQENKSKMASLFKKE